MKQLEPTDCAYLAGLIMGWTMVLEQTYEREIDRQKDFRRVMKDMHEVERKLAKKGGVTIKI